MLYIVKAQMVSFRTWLRSVKNIKDNNTLKDAIIKYDNTINNKTGVRSLQLLVCKELKKGMNDKTVIEMLKILNVLIPNISSSDATTQTAYLEIRKCIKSMYGTESPIVNSSYKIMRFDQDKWRENRAKYQAMVAERNNNKKQYSEDLIYGVMERIKNKTTPSVEDLAIALQLSSGARIGEILTYADFKKIDKNTVQQKNILKAKDRDTIIKPLVYYDASQFLDMLNKLRNKLQPEINKIKRKKETHYNVSQSHNGKINRKIRKYFDASNNNETTSHDLRKIYAAISYRDTADKAKVSEAAYLSDILGHAKDSLDVSKSYSTVSIIKRDLEEAREDQKENPEELVVPRNLVGVRDGLVMERIAETARILRLKNMPVNNAVLRSYGYGGEVVKRYLLTKNP